MVDKIVPSYCYLKGTTFYFTRHVPVDIQKYYSTQRIQICLKTRSPYSAANAIKSINQKLDDYWMALRLSTMDNPALRFLKDRAVELSSVPLLSEALDTYLRLKGSNKAPTFHRGAKRNIKAVVDVLGDKPIDQYRSSDAAAFRDYSLERGLTVASVKRNFSTIRSIINLTLSEQGIDCRNPFSKVFFPELDDVKDRKPIPEETLKLIQSKSKQINDDRRWLLSLISDTGMRLAEAAGLAKEDICLDAEIPHLVIQPHPWRSLKTKSSSRLIPLVGASLWAAKQVLNDQANTTAFAFPRYTNEADCNANSASATLNKWLHNNFPGDYVVHSFRHSFRDRLRAIQCPTEVIDQLGGWNNKSVGEGYGEGYSLSVLSDWLTRFPNIQHPKKCLRINELS